MFSFQETRFFSTISLILTKNELLKARYSLIVLKVLVSPNHSVNHSVSVTNCALRFFWSIALYMCVCVCVYVCVCARVCVFVCVEYILQLVSEFCRLDLTCPVPGCDPDEVRSLILEGMLRLRDSSSAKVRPSYDHTHSGAFKAGGRRHWAKLPPLRRYANFSSFTVLNNAKFGQLILSKTVKIVAAT